MGCICSSPEVSPPHGLNADLVPVPAKISPKLQLYYAQALERMKIPHKVRLLAADSTATGWQGQLGDSRQQAEVSNCFNSSLNPLAWDHAPLMQYEICLEEFPQLDMFCARGAGDKGHQKLTATEVREGCGHLCCKTCTQVMCPLKKERKIYAFGRGLTKSH